MANHPNRSRKARELRAAKDAAESNRQALIRVLMEDEGLTYQQAMAKESERFNRAMHRFLTTGQIT